MPYRAGYHLRHRHRGRARRHAAGVIGRAYRRTRWRRNFRKRHAAGKQRYNRTKNVSKTTLGKRGYKRTLNKRVSALESGSNKHWDQVSLTQEIIGISGTNLNPAGNSFSSILAIQGPLATAAAGNPYMDEAEQRMNDTIFCKSVRLRGCVYGVRPLDAGLPTGGVMLFGLGKMEELCNTRVHISVLQDMRPSVVGADGNSSVNPLPTTPGETPLESIYQTLLPGTSSASQLLQFGVENAQRSYNSSRFKLIHQECLTTTMASYRKYFDIKIKVNRKLKYVPPRQGAPSNPPAVPYNYNLIVVFTATNPAIATDPTWAGYLSGPMVTQKTSRTYFTDS